MTQAYAYNLGYLFHRVAAERGDAAALTYPDLAVSFAELDRLSSRIAHLLQSRGIGRRDVVAIFHEKTPDAYACMIACLKIGAIYTNLDTSSPAARLGKILDRAQPKLLVAAESGLGLASELAEPRAIDVVQYGCEAFAAALDGLPDDLPEKTRDVVGTDPAYLMFTSGSTGFPKGAVISHGSVQNFVDWANQEIGVGPDDALTNVNPMHFDNSVFDFYAGLFNGARLVPLDEKIARNPRLLVRAAGEAGCTVWFSVPSLLVYTLRMRGLGREDLHAMRKIVFGGEGFPKAPLRQLHELVGDRIQLINVYGPTECTCICSAYPVQASDLESPALLPLGPIAPNFDFLVVGEDRRPVEDGELGELCLLGPNVGLGYYNDPERTAAAFVQAPSNTGFGDALLHGEAVSIGMVLAFELSARLGLCPRADAERVRAHLAAVGLPTGFPAHPGSGWDARTLLDQISHDKKVRDGRPTFVLAHAIGDAFLTSDVAPDDVVELLSGMAAAA